MLTNLSIFILGIITERPTNPYEITKYAEDVSIQNWIQVPKQSVYSSIRALEKSGYIVGKSVKEGKFPDKTVYSITDDGHKAFLGALEDFLGNTRWDYAEFNLSSIFICHLSKERALEVLKKKGNYLKDKEENLSFGLKRFREQAYSETGIHAVRHMQILTQAEIKSVEELIETVKKDNEWNHFFAVDMTKQGRGI